MLLFSLKLPDVWSDDPREVLSLDLCFFSRTPTWQVSEQFTSRHIDLLDMAIKNQSARACHVVVKAFEKQAADQKVRHLTG